MTPEWTDEKIALLRQLHADNLKFDDMVGPLGMSRSAIIGKAHRLGLPPRNNMREPRTNSRNHAHTSELNPGMNRLVSETWERKCLHCREVRLMDRGNFVCIECKRTEAWRALA
jgi:GcrA cell cycle regulator